MTIHHCYFKTPVYVSNARRQGVMNPCLGRLVSNIDSVRYFVSVDWVSQSMFVFWRDYTIRLRTCVCIAQIRRWSLYLDKESREVSFLWLWNCDAVASLSLEGNTSSDFSCANLVKVA